MNIQEPQRTLDNDAVRETVNGKRAKAQRRRWLPRRIFRYGVFIMISILLLVTR
jgi:hypothetical protein